MKIAIRDFAGATVVHLVGGTAALVGVFILDPRWTCQFPKDTKGYDLRDEIIPAIIYPEPDEEYQNNLTKAHNPRFVTRGNIWIVR